MCRTFNMMRLKDEVIYPRILMLLAGTPKVLIVEGSKNQLVYEQLFDSDSMIIEYAKGKKKVLACMRKFESPEAAHPLN